ncbi:MAG: hypothetical protein JWM34_4513 [Ilumatobacteraceae bacterium]|nr:hypothetical protein [Ilumatobacteraceae bacterium]
MSALVALVSVLAGTPPTDPPNGGLGPVSQSPDDVRDAACKLVEAKSVCSPPSTAPQSIPRTGTPSAGGLDGVFGLFLWIVLAAVVVAIAFLAYRSLAGRYRASRRGDGDDDVDPDDDALAGTVVIDRSREPGGWRDEAERHRAEGRFRDALRCRYRALVGDLARRGLLDEIPGRTTGEERRELQVSAPAAVGSFREAADLFDAAWFGHATVDAADDDRFQQLDRDVLANAGSLAHRVPRAYEPSPA